VLVFGQLCVSQDWAGALALESKVTAIANRSENKDPSLAGDINFMLGMAHMD